jgi:hypothetical protein
MELNMYGSKYVWFSISMNWIIMIGLISELG